MLKFSHLAAAATVALGLAATTSDAVAGNGHKDDGRHFYSYAVKFVCGTEKAQFTHNFYPPVVQGTYATAINIYNPNDFSVKVDARGMSTSHNGGQGSIDSRSYNPSWVNKIDCSDLYRYFRVNHDELLKGIVYIESKWRLDVIGVYTSGDGKFAGATIDVEHVTGRKVDGKGRAGELVD